MSGIPSCSENTSRLTASLYRMRIFMFSVYRSKKNRPQRASLTTCKARLHRLTPSPDPSGWSAGPKRFPARPESFSGVSRFGPSWRISTLCSSRWFSSSPASFRSGTTLRSCIPGDSPAGAGRNSSAPQPRRARLRDAGRDRHPPCDRGNEPRHCGLCVGRSGRRVPRNRGNPRARETSRGLVPARARHGSQQSLQDLWRPSVHEPQVDETLGLIAPVRHMQDMIELRAEQAEVSRPEGVRRVMAPDLASPGTERVELRRGDRPARRPDGQLNCPPSLHIDEEPGGAPLLGPPDPVIGDGVVDVHRLTAESQIPVVRQADHDEVRRTEDEMRRGHNMIPGRRFHAAPVNSAANGGAYDIMSSETRRTMSTPVTSDG